MLLDAPYRRLGQGGFEGRANLVLIDGTCELVREPPPPVVRLVRLLDLLQWLADDGRRFGQLKDLLDGRMIDYEWLPAIPGRTDLDLVADFGDLATLTWSEYQELTRRGPRLFLSDRASARFIQRFAWRDARIPRALDPLHYRFEDKTEKGALSPADFASVAAGADETRLQPAAQIPVLWKTKTEANRGATFVHASETQLNLFASAGRTKDEAKANLIRRIRRAVALGLVAEDEAGDEARSAVAEFGFRLGQ